MTIKTIWGVIALATTMGTGIATAAVPRSACADLNNNGVCDAGDVSIDKQISNDGYFSTARSEGNYTAPASGKVGIVLTGRVLGKSGIVYLVASGDIVVNDSVGSAAENSAAILTSTGGSIRIADGGRVRGGLFMKLSAAQDVEIGNKATLSARNRDFGGQVYVFSSGGSIRVGEKVAITGDGFTSVTTHSDTGADVSIGAGTKIKSTKASVAVTAGNSVSMRSVGVSADAVLIGSYGAANDRGTAEGPGRATVRNCVVEGDSAVRVFADGGEGSMVDVTGTNFEAPKDAVSLDADVVVK